MSAARTFWAVLRAIIPLYSLILFNEMWEVEREILLHPKISVAGTGAVSFCWIRHFNH
jgi:hypothetical protein